MAFEAGCIQCQVLLCDYFQRFLCLCACLGAVLYTGSYSRSYLVSVLHLSILCMPKTCLLKALNLLHIKPKPNPHQPQTYLPYQLQTYLTSTLFYLTSQTYQKFSSDPPQWHSQPALDPALNHPIPALIDLISSLKALRQSRKLSAPVVLVPAHGPVQALGLLKTPRGLALTQLTAGCMYTYIMGSPTTPLYTTPPKVPP